MGNRNSTIDISLLVGGQYLHYRQGGRNPQVDTPLPEERHCEEHCTRNNLQFNTVKERFVFAKKNKGKTIYYASCLYYITAHQTTKMDF